jgi:acetyl-CoA carboxylase carboxyltransferase component
MAVDTPGFLINRDGERIKITGKIINFMNALQLVTVPKLTVVIRKSYGQAHMNMGGTRNSDTYAAGLQPRQALGEEKRDILLP